MLAFLYILFSHLGCRSIFLRVMNHFRCLIIYSKHPETFLTRGITSLTYQLVQPRSHNCDQRLLSLFGLFISILLFESIIGRLTTELSLLLFVKLNHFMEREVRAHFVPHHEQVRGIVKEHLISILEKHPCLIFGHVFIDKLDCLKWEFCQHIVDEVGELLFVMATH